MESVKTMIKLESEVVDCCVCGCLFTTTSTTLVCRECADNFVKEQVKKEKKRITKKVDKEE
jgi:hypothetical protein